jgi:uncharacterized protein (TIGR02145 family)
MKIKLKNRISLIVVCASFLVLAVSCKKEAEDDPSVIKDGDGNVYTSVKIGTQTWLNENLKTTKLNDGTSIPLVTDNTEWKNLITPGYCWYNNDKTTYGNIYGPLYNWYAIGTGKLCPKGWHVPSNDEMDVLDIALENDGGKLKETGTAHWQAPNTGASDRFGFRALPGGYRDHLLSFGDINTHGAWWTSSVRTQLDHPYVFILIYNTGNWTPYAEVVKNFGYSVRCIKD